MSVKQKHVVRFFDLVQEEKEMTWLNQMALSGWYLVRVMFFVYTFEQGEPSDTRYYGDFKTMKQHDIGEYLQIFTDCGWKFVCQQGSWYYFSSLFDKNYREVYSNKQSQLEKYRTVLLTLIIPMVMLINSLLILSRRSERSPSFGLDILLFIVFTLLLIAIYSTIRIIGKVTKLQKSVSE